MLIAGLIDVLPTVDSDLKKIAARVLEKAREVCAAKSVSALVFGFFFVFLLLSSAALDFH